jgi:hypothetical protein
VGLGTRPALQKTPGCGCLVGTADFSILSLRSDGQFDAQTRLDFLKRG